MKKLKVKNLTPKPKKVRVRRFKAIEPALKAHYWSRIEKLLPDFSLREIARALDIKSPETVRLIIQKFKVKENGTN